jgi:cation diffusion facilitator CzcD-associated flavoprotein CzcO
VPSGFHGLAAAKHYRCSQPDHAIAILDSQASVGGTWAQERLYPGLKTNNIFGTYQYPDFPMLSGRFGAEPGKHIPGRAVHEYLKSYADEFDLSKHIRLNTKVVSAERQETKENSNGAWLLTVLCNGQTSAIFTRRLIVASGLTSEPNGFRIIGQESFGGPIFHGRDFGQNADTVTAGQTATVYGSTKYAWDAAYAYAVAGAKVHWIIRGIQIDQLVAKDVLLIRK